MSKHAILSRDVIVSFGGRDFSTDGIHVRALDRGACSDRETTAVLAHARRTLSAAESAASLAYDRLLDAETKHSAPDARRLFREARMALRTTLDATGKARANSLEVEQAAIRSLGLLKSWGLGAGAREVNFI